MILEENSLEAIVSLKRANTAGIDLEIPILKNNSKFSDNTGNDIRKLIKLIKDKSYESQ